MIFTKAGSLFNTIVYLKHILHWKCRLFFILRIFTPCGYWKKAMTEVVDIQIFSILWTAQLAANAKLTFWKLSSHQFKTFNFELFRIIFFRNARLICLIIFIAYWSWRFQHNTQFLFLLHKLYSKKIKIAQKQIFFLENGYSWNSYRIFSTYG